MPSTEQLQKIALLSDTVLYQEAVNFVRDLVQKQHCNPLPNSQLNGLLNVANSSSYEELSSFVVHQRDRDWPFSKKDIKIFYTALEQLLSRMRQRRIFHEFRLLDGAKGRSIDEMRAEANAVTALVAREFILHLEAENRLLQAEQDDKRRQEQQERPQRQK